MPPRIVLASGNRGKLAEIRDVLADTGIELIAQSDLGIADADETGTTFVENAIIKARHAARASGLPALGDDSGICVDALGGAPGIYVRLHDPRSHAMLPQRPKKREGSAAPVPDFEGLGKIAALGIKVSRHCTYHGVALNVAMDLEPFDRINPCGYAGLRTVDLSTIGVQTTWEEAAQVLGQQLSIRLAP